RVAAAHRGGDQGEQDRERRDPDRPVHEGKRPADDRQRGEESGDGVGGAVRLRLRRDAHARTRAARAPYGARPCGPGRLGRRPGRQGSRGSISGPSFAWTIAGSGGFGAPRTTPPTPKEKVENGGLM